MDKIKLTKDYKRLYENVVSLADEEYGYRDIGDVLNSHTNDEIIDANKLASDINMYSFVVPSLKEFSNKSLKAYGLDLEMVEEYSDYYTDLLATQLVQLQPADSYRPDSYSDYLSSLNNPQGLQTLTNILGLIPDVCAYDYCNDITNLVCLFASANYGYNREFANNPQYDLKNYCYYPAYSDGDIEVEPGRRKI